MAHCDIELTKYQAHQKKVPEMDQCLYESSGPSQADSSTSSRGEPATIQPETNTLRPTTSQQPMQQQQKNLSMDLQSNIKENQVPKMSFTRNKLLAAIIMGLVALNVLLIICLTAIALQSHTGKQDIIRLIKDLNSTAQLIMDSHTNTTQGISAAVSSSQKQTASQQWIVNMTASLIEDMVKNITAQLMLSHMNTVHDLKETLANTAGLLEQSISHHQVLQQSVMNMTARLIEDMVRNITTQLITTHMNIVHDLEEIMNRSTNNITQLLNISTDQLMTQNLDIANILIENNYYHRNALSSQLASLTSAINTHSATSLSTKHIVQNMENTLETLNSQHKILLSPTCQEIKNSNPDSTSGYYTVNGEVMYCKMGELCGSEGGWTRLAYLDMNDTTVNCPSNFSYKYSSGIRACTRPDSSGGSCASVQFPSNSISYSEVCGRVVGYQFGSHEAANGGGTIDSPYLEGISITRGNPHQHVWSLMVGRGEISGSSSSCPCNSLSAGSAPPSFVGNDYFCESGNPTASVLEELFPNDPLWDGKQCGGNEANCCSAAGLPWFHKTLSTDTTDYLELRNCGDQTTGNENVYINFYEIYIK